MSSPRRTHGRRSASGAHRARPRPRIRLAVTGAAVLAVVGGGTAFACLGVPHQSTSAHAGKHISYRLGTQQPNRTAPPTAATTKAPATPSHRAKPGHHRPTAKPTPKPTATRPSSTPTAKAPAPPTATAPTTGTTSGDAVQQVLALINQNRKAQGLAPYTLFDGLNASAAAHNQVMAGGCGLSHQCPGEPAFGDRETAAGVHWTSAGENIGEGGGVGSSAKEIAASAVGLTQMMLNEKAPDDGHRRNILSSSFTRIGIAVHRDASGTVWLTQDFAS